LEHNTDHSELALCRYGVVPRVHNHKWREEVHKKTVPSSIDKSAAGGGRHTMQGTFLRQGRKAGPLQKWADEQRKTDYEK